MSLVETTCTLPRHAFAPGELARAGDVWRMLQEVAIEGSTRLGWPPARYVEERAGFVVRTMTVRHLAPIVFGDAIDATTWVSSMRRDMFTHREIRARGPRGPVVAATQGWVHVAVPSLAPSRASKDLVDALVVVDREPSVAFPEATAAATGPAEAFPFQAWHTWMDPLAHANHPAYVDWVDEAISRRMHAAGLDPHTLQPVAERITFRAGVVAGDQVVVHTELIGTDGADAFVQARITDPEGKPFADGTFVRRNLLAALQ